MLSSPSLCLLNGPNVKNGGFLRADRGVCKEHRRLEHNNNFVKREGIKQDHRAILV